MGDEDQLQETGNPGIVLSVLTSIERDSSITQRKLANELGIALGLANAYLRRCVRKGLIKMSQVPLNRYAYYLTPQGFAEKSRLTAEYLAVSLDFFRRSRSDCVVLFRQCEALGWQKVALYGAGDLAEIAILSASETAVEVTGTVERDPPPTQRLALPKQGDAIAARAAEEIERHCQVFGGQPAFFGKSLRRQVIGIAVQRHLAHLDETLAHAAPQIGIGKPERDAEFVCELALSNRAVALYRGEHAQHDTRIAGLLKLAFVPHTRSPFRPRGQATLFTA